MPSGDRLRARSLGVAPGIFPIGPLNSITDVSGVTVGHATRIEGAAVRTGITAVLPHRGNLFHDRVPTGLHVGNGFGKLIGSTQVEELGELESPILLTSTLNVWRVADALAQWMLEQPHMSNVRSVNPLVGETNDGVLNDVRLRPLGLADVMAAIESASSECVPEGCVGAGTGTIAFGWKGGIGSSSRVLPQRLGGATVGVLVQANFGGVLQICGVPVGRALNRYAFKEELTHERGDGSVMMVLATDAPLGDRNLRRLASRAMLGLSRTGSSAANGSGDYAIAFSTASEVRRKRGRTLLSRNELANEQMSALFQAAVEGTEEAIYNALFMATPLSGNG
ncbi:MAG: P1 family peptidase, partial [Pseudomonadota bacterium]|nr:P1 family peptidase [Pseudomonadota bacterium]